jgi:hypothetical protein
LGPPASREEVPNLTVAAPAITHRSDTKMKKAGVDEVSDGELVEE